MRFGLDGALTGGVGTTDLWVWPLSADAPILIGQRGGGACWLGARVMAQVADRLVYLDRETGWQPTPVVDPMNGRPDTLGANWLQASLGGRTWCGTRESTPHYTRGFFMGQPFQDDKNVLAVSAQDDLILSDLVVRWATGGVTPLPADLNVESLRVRDGLVAYVDTVGRAHVMTANGELPVQWRGPGQAVPFAWRVGGTVMVAYFTEADGMIVHLATDRSRGASFGRVAFSFDVFLDVDDWAYYGFALGSGEDANVAVRQRRRLPEQFADLDAPIVVAPVVDEPPQTPLRFAPIDADVAVFDEPGAPQAFEFETIGGGEAGPADLLPAKIAAAVARARAAGVRFLAFSDTDTFDPAIVPRGDEDGGPRIRVVAAQRCYPSRVPGQPERSVADTRQLVDDSVQELQRHGHEVELVLGFYRQINTVTPPSYNWTLPTTLATIAAGVDIARTRGLHRLNCFLWQRGHDIVNDIWRDGIVSRPEFLATLANLRAAAQLTTHNPDPSPAPTPAPDPPEDEPMRTLTGYLHTDVGQFIAVDALNKLHLTADKAAAVLVDIVVLDQAKQIVELQRHDNGLPIAPLRSYPPYDLEDKAGTVYVTPGMAMRWHAGPGLEFRDQYAFGDVDPNGPYYLNAEHVDGAPVTMKPDSDGPQHQRAWKFQHQDGTEHVGPF